MAMWKLEIQSCRGHLYRETKPEFSPSSGKVYPKNKYVAPGRYVTLNYESVKKWICYQRAS